MPTAPIAFADVRAARERLAPHLPPTPLRHYPLLDAVVGHDIRVLIKHENHHPTQSFKVRNGVAAVTALSAEERTAGVIAPSTGNHGLGLAWAGARLGVPVTIVVPVGNNPDKNAAMRALGAEVVEHGAVYDESSTRCDELAVARGMTLVHGIRHREVLAGAATLALELLEQAPPELTTLVMAVGGGSQAMGACVVRDAMRAGLRVVGVQSEAGRGQHDAWHAGRILPRQPTTTFAEGIATGSAYEATFDTLKSGLHDFVLVSDDELRDAMRTLIRITKNLPEGSAAAGLAAVRRYAERMAGETVAVVMCGGNESVERLSALWR